MLTPKLKHLDVLLFADLLSSLIETIRQSLSQKFFTKN